MRRAILVVLVILGLAVAVDGRVLGRQSGPLCFDVPGISNCISGRFRQYWEANGGLAVFGYPITPARNERNRDTGQTYLTQWFQRNRFELHPANAAPYDVLLGRLGDDRLRVLGVRWQNLPREDGPAAGCLWFPDTGHNVCNQSSGLGFRTFWQSNGLGDPALDSYGNSLALFGLPLTGAALETNSSGDRVITQWFERARFEWHPDQPAAFKVLLGLLGAELQGTTPPNPSNPANPTATATRTPTAQPTATRTPTAQPTATRTPTATSKPPENRDVGMDYPPGGDTTNPLVKRGGIFLPDWSNPRREDARPIAQFKERVLFGIDVSETAEDVQEGQPFGIQQVEITITDPEGTEVTRQVELNPTYCPFGDAGLNTPCTAYVFADHGGTWPDGTAPIYNQRYTVNAQITTLSSSNDTTWFFDFELLPPD